MKTQIYHSIRTVLKPK